MALFVLEKVSFKGIIEYPDIEIVEHGATFVCGESGCGKSTLLRLLNGVVSPTGGTIYYRGSNVEGLEPIALRRDVLLVGQSPYLFDKSIKGNFDDYHAYRDMEPPDDAVVRKCLDVCAVGLSLDAGCATLSGGEAQRVFIAINLSFPQKVLMLDEPTSALDDKNANALVENVKAHCRANGVTLVVVSHDRAIAERHADNLIVLGGVRR